MHCLYTPPKCSSNAGTIKGDQNLRVIGAGLFPNTSSISSIISPVSFGIRSKALTLLCTCSTFDAPVMAELTLGFFKTQANARAAWSQPNLSAIG